MTRRLVFAVFFGGVLFASYVVEDLGHDEGMYLGASYLAMDKSLYSEFSYFQAPYLPLLLGISLFHLRTILRPACVGFEQFLEKRVSLRAIREGDLVEIACLAIHVHGS